MMRSKQAKQWRQRYLTEHVSDGETWRYWSLPKLAQDYHFSLEEQPLVVRLFLENVMRHSLGDDDQANIIQQLCASNASQAFEFSFFPSRVLMQDYTGVPAIVDLAAMRDAVHAKGGDAKRINPLCPVDLVIDHSVIVDKAGTADALSFNRQREMERNRERYQFLKWAQGAFDNLTVVPPGRGICHQVNLEYLAQVVRQVDGVLSPDTLVGTDSHTTMINGLGVLGWGVGGIEAEAVMLGQPLSLNTPKVVGVNLLGALSPGLTATDLVLTLTELLRNHGVVGKYVEFYGAGLANLSVADRATIANMAPEYGATCALFPIDDQVINYLTLTHRPADLVKRVRDYAHAQGLFYQPGELASSVIYSENLTVDLGEIVPCVAGPKRPQDRLPLAAIKQKTLDEIALAGEHSRQGADDEALSDGDLVIAAITSCTNTSNPQVMVLAGILAKAAVEKGMTVKPHVKTSLAPGSQVVARYLDQSGLQGYLDQLGFQRVGFGCTTCIGNSGPLNDGLEAVIAQGKLQVCGVLSGNRNFEGRIHPFVRMNWLASPPLVVAFALVGHTRIDLDTEPLGTDRDGNAVFLRDLWPDSAEVAAVLAQINRALYGQSYANMTLGDDTWRGLKTDNAVCYPWQKESTYIRQAPFVACTTPPKPIVDGRILAIFGDSITTDHISPAGQIDPLTPAGEYLLRQGVKAEVFNSYGARRGNHEVMVRGTFANRRLKNRLVDPMEGGFTRIWSPPGGSAPQQSDRVAAQTAPVSIYQASQHYLAHQVSLVIFAGKEYGTGSSRDWAAKGCLLLNIKAVIARSFERIHRSNLVGMGIMPLLLPADLKPNALQLSGDELISITAPSANGFEVLLPRQILSLRIAAAHSSPSPLEPVVAQTIPVTLAIENERELAYFFAGGILPYVADQFCSPKRSRG
ncbi:aconitase [Ferrimonas sediminum]|uniref:Aconitate hydratase n=2 Tax=Ferrimonas sediminum TaxID=718193 RepID=A0A1G8RKM6_9GAMM|nr:aconitase [Ferrimonas sediminum]